MAPRSDATHVVLVGCGQAKRATPHPARDLYIGSLFRAARDYAEASGHPWHVVSGLHGLLNPSETVAPYDSRVPGGSETMSDWGQRVWQALETRYGYGAALRVEVLAGVMYAAPVRLHAPNCCEVVTPLDELELGYRLAWFRSQRLAREAA